MSTDFLIKARNLVELTGYQYLLKPIYFQFDPEKVHNQMTKAGNKLGSSRIGRAAISLAFNYSNPILEQEICGIKFKNPIGLAGGFDKHAELTQILPSVGFGFMEIGSITAKPYAGNTDSPRLKRLPNSKSLQVYYGLKNDGAKATLDRLQKLQFEIPLGINIAKTNCAETCDLEVGVEDYFETYQLFTSAGIGDYITINVSCPNAFGGQPFHDKESLEKLLGRIFSVEKIRPLFLKISPDLSSSQIDDILLVAAKYPIDGFICSNLTKDLKRPEVKDIPNAKGGLSGKVVEELSNQLLSYIYKKTKGKYVMIGLGGVFTAEDAFKKIQLGASLVQLITGMIYRGPAVISDINLGLAEILKKKGYQNIFEAIGKF